MGTMFREADFAPTPPVTSGRHLTRRVTVLSVQPQFPRRRGVAGPAAILRFVDVAEFLHGRPLGAQPAGDDGLRLAVSL